MYLIFFYLKFQDENKNEFLVFFFVFLITLVLWIIHHAIVYSMAMRYSCVYRDVYFFYRSELICLSLVFWVVAP